MLRRYDIFNIKRIFLGKIKNFRAEGVSKIKIKIIFWFTNSYIIETSTKNYLETNYNILDDIQLTIIKKTMKKKNSSFYQSRYHWFYSISTFGESLALITLANKKKTYFSINLKTFTVSWTAEVTKTRLRHQVFLRPQTFPANIC